MSRKSGVFLNVSSLPSPFGIGVFGREAKAWIDSLAESGFCIWQVLPFNPIGSGNSPYASPSAFAGNVLYIDPRTLAEEALLTYNEVVESFYHGSPYTVDYGFATEKKEFLLRRAFSRADTVLLEKVRRFGEDNKHIKDYALFLVAKKHNDDKPWWLWGREYDYKNAVEIEKLYYDEVMYHLFCQYLFFEQWAEIKAYANEKGIEVFGDMPIYVSQDSADVWTDSKQFLLDEKTKLPKDVAGVPPDFFSPDGQLWGNPLYDWETMEKDGFKWWRERIEGNLRLYDIVRIDHFRAFASYYAIPYGAETAKDGEWREGVGYKFFEALADVMDKDKIIAEDLGTFGEDVVKLLEDTGFPGMRVVQFGMAFDEESTHTPHNCTENCVAYLGTHDNNTLLGWLFEIDERERDYVLAYCAADKNGWDVGGYKAPACRRIIETVWRSGAKIAMISFQDICGFGADARMNTPGTAEGNWCFRATEENIESYDKGYYKWINFVFRRLNQLLVEKKTDETAEDKESDK